MRGFSGAVGGDAQGAGPGVRHAGKVGSARRGRPEGNVHDQPKVADGASDFLQEVFGPDKNPTRLVYGVASLPLGTPVEVELIFEVQP